MALQLRRQGVMRVRPLQGGLSLWMERAFPTAEITQRTGSGAVSR